MIKTPNYLKCKQDNFDDGKEEDKKTVKEKKELQNIQ